MTPRPSASRHAARRWLSEQMRTRIIGTKFAMTKPKSIWTFVNMINQRFLCPSFNSPVLSAQATLPAGYSPLRCIRYCHLQSYRWLDTPNTDTDQKSVCCQSCQRSFHASTCPVWSGGERSKHDQDDCACHERPLPRVVIADPTEEQLPHDRTSEGKRGDIRLCWGVCIAVAVYRAQHGVDLPNDPMCALSVDTISTACTGRCRSMAYPLR